MKPHKHAELIKAWADGAEIEKLVILYMSVKGWRQDNSPSWDIEDAYRIKPSLKPVDLSVLIDSGIDCEFSFKGSNQWSINTLHHLVSCSKKPTYHVRRDNQGYTKCRPRMNHVHAWQGGECPLPEGLMVEVRRPVIIMTPTASPISPNPQPLPASLSSAQQVVWGEEPYITGVGYKWWKECCMFEVIGLADGYCWPWEV